jgi:hypothetical protein
MRKRQSSRAVPVTVGPVVAIVVGCIMYVVGFTSPAEARITKIVITRVESPTFQGAVFDGVGQYEKIVGRAFGEVDPNDPRNAVITDIAFAPRNARGMIDYSTDIYLLKPVDSWRGNHRVFFEINNRGNNFSFGQMNNATTGGNDPTTAADAGNGFLMRQGYAIVFSGWDVTVAPGGGRFTMTVPLAKNPNGSSIVGPSLEEFVIDNNTTMTGPLTYPAASLNKNQANLTTRVHYEDPPTPIPPAGWEYVNAQTIRLLPAGTPFQTGRLYEFTYPAKDPLVAGLAFAGLRDLTAFLRHAVADDFGTPNPLSGDVEHVYTFSVSQPTRFLHDFLHLGFNEDEHGRRVFDGNLNWIGGASGGFFNYRFAQPGRTHRQHIGRWYPERQFPFANQVIFDPITGKTDGVLGQCLTTDTCPKILEVNSENEYWAKAGSLLHTDTLGNDLNLSRAERIRKEKREHDHEGDRKREEDDDVPANVRYYLLSSLPHSAGIGPTGLGICQQPRNPLVANATLRALLVALDEWVSHGEKPPKNAVPRRSNGTLVPSHPQAGMGFPNIPGVTYNGRLHEGDLFDFGPSFEEGILSVPPFLLGSPYPALVPKTDQDGNDIAGVRMVEIEVPVATYTGWGLRAGPAAGDGCDAAGQKIDFAQTEAERLATGDPRLSIEERYPTHEAYAKKVRHAARRLYHRGLLLEEDVQRYVAQAEASGIGR